MAAVLGDGHMRLMHPFFRKASFKTSSKPPTPTKSEDATNTTEDTYSPGTDSTPYDEGNEDSPISISASQSGDLAPSYVPENYRRSEYEKEKMEAGITGGFAVDLNLDRRKRRKITPSTESETPASGNGEDWLHQLKEAAVDAPKPILTPTSVAVLTLSNPPETKKSASKQSTSPQKTLLKMRKNVTAEANAKKSTIDEAASSASTPAMASPAAKPTPKKLLKLNANGKLLSSPISVSPVSKRKGNRGYKKHNVCRITLRYGSDQETRSRIGMKINKLLSKPSISQHVLLPRDNAPPKATHPFFLGKQAQNSEFDARAGSSDTSSRDQVLGTTDKRDPLHATVAWKDIVFKSQKPIFTKNVDVIGAPWPSIDIQHLGAEVNKPLLVHPLKPYGAAISKSKEQRTQITPDEDVMHNFSRLLELEANSLTNGLRLPQRVLATGQQMLAVLDKIAVSTQDKPSPSTTTHAAINQMRSLLPTSSTAFEQGGTGSGSAWTVQYAPCSANDVLQPTTSLLRDWMRKLTTSVTQTIPPSPRSKLAQLSKKQSRKNKRRKISNELEGFIASSDDEFERAHERNVKNAVLISGPPGCGKTASVFAVAKELDFEVFEVHPGMRRNAKDIFDKVGDMTQNHHVQGVGNKMAAEPTPNTIEIDLTNHEIASGKQSSMSNFFSKSQTSKQRKSPRKTKGKDVKNAKAPKAQKQSMILLEEVDVLFDEDKGFWTGVMSLINQSKRPVVLTCNEESSVPFDDLPLYATWRYEAPNSDVASEYLVTMAANEGHILNRDCVRALYQSRGYDLRATITELDFWCQMGIGSLKGGLDWMLDYSSTNSAIKTTDAPLRVFSKDSYVSETGLPLPTRVSSAQQQEELLKYAQEYLEIPVTNWQEASDVLHRAESSSTHVESSRKRIDVLQGVVELFDSRSVLDLFDDSLTPTLSIKIAAALTPDKPLLQEEDVVQAYFKNKGPEDLTKDDLLSALEPMTIEKPTFPPALGRLAPSLEGPMSPIATDIAPYVRSIVAFDQRLELQREAMAGDLQGKKVRKTRAARAALEGGSKANTRRERWFPETTDYEKVMKTAGKGWPIWALDSAPGGHQSQELMEVSSPETGAHEAEHGVAI